MRILWDLKTRMRANEDPRVGIDLAVTLIADVHTKTRPQAPTPVSAPRKLSLNDMKVMHP
jgi:hypothetical protein